MQLCIREYDIRDFEQVLEISQSFYAGKHGSFSLVDNISGKRMIAKYVIGDLETGLIYGYAVLAEQIQPSIKLRLELLVKNEFAMREKIHELFNQIESVIKKVGPYSVETRVFIANTKEINFFEENGFSENHRMVKQILHVPSGNFDSYIHVENELRKNGVILRTLAEEQANRPAYMKHLEMLVLDTNSDFPDELPSHLRRPNTNTAWLHSSEIIPEAFFIAIHQGRYVGYSHLIEGPNHSLIQGFTAVCRDFRNLGIATILKLRGISYAKKKGIDIIYTANRSSNGSMARVNEKLGWSMYDSEIRMEKVVN